jgi:minor extracellular protease Epr
MTQRMMTALLLSSLILPMPALLPPMAGLPDGAALAQDNGGGSDDNGGDSDDSGSGSGSGSGVGNGGGSDDGPRRQPRQRAGATPPPPPPLAAPDEVVVSDLSPEALTVLQGEGYEVISQEDLASFGLRLTRLRVPGALGLEAGRARVRALPGGEDADFNHFYRAGQGAEMPDAEAACGHENCPSLDLVGWPVERMEACRVRVSIGVIDTGVNAGHDILTGARLEVVRLADSALDPSAAVHGTAVTSLLVGAEESRVPGLIPEAEVIAVDVFSDVAGDERADVPSLLRGLDLLRGRGVRVMNLSLAGPENGVLQAALDAMAGPEGAVIVAAVGNAGPDAPPAWPAAHPGVLAVTAVDARGRVYRGAQRGEHIDLAAPGVGLLAATSIKGARGKTGTSYAVPFVTAAAAVMLSRNPALTPDEVAAGLKAQARDLGAEGPDDVFGAGLLEASAICELPMK